MKDIILITKVKYPLGTTLKSQNFLTAWCPEVTIIKNNRRTNIICGINFHDLECFKVSSVKVSDYDYGEDKSMNKDRFKYCTVYEYKDEITNEIVEGLQSNDLIVKDLIFNSLLVSKNKSKINIQKWENYMNKCIIKKRSKKK